MYHRILVPTDGSAGTDRAIAHAIDLAGKYDASLHALYVVDETYPPVAHYDVVVEELEEQGEAAVEAVEARAAEAGLPVEKHLRRASPPRRSSPRYTTTTSTWW
jgi:nucleotide-binding universal stress UspA family protein